MCETRPRLQGARLSAFELWWDQIPLTLITDNMVGYIMSQGLASKVIVGADRILSSGHVINKIGTLTVALIARAFKIPFYVAAPLSTFDLHTQHQDVVIEERDENEVKQIGGVSIAPSEVPVLNPAFDITPPELITAIITERGAVTNPYMKNILKLFKG